MGILITVLISKSVVWLWTDRRTKKPNDRRTGERASEWKHKPIIERSERATGRVHAPLEDIISQFNTNLNIGINYPQNDTPIRKQSRLYYTALITLYGRMEPFHPGYIIR